MNNKFGSGSWIQASAPSAAWAGVASDSTGRHLAAVVYEGFIYTNKKYGSGSWIQTSAPSENWNGVACDYTGQYLAAVVDVAFIFARKVEVAQVVKSDAAIVGCD